MTDKWGILWGRTRKVVGYRDDEVHLDVRKRVQVREEVGRVDKKVEVVHLQRRLLLQRRHTGRMGSPVGT